MCQASKTVEVVSFGYCMSLMAAESAKTFQQRAAHTPGEFHYPRAHILEDPADKKAYRTNRPGGE